MKGGDTINIKAAGLPNLTGEIRNQNDGYAVNAAGGLYAAFENNGCFTFDNAAGTSITAQVTGANVITSINFNAAQCNTIYGKSLTVTPPSLVHMPQIKF